MNKQFVLTTIFLILTVARTDAQLLFRISGAGLEKPSYMLGSVHHLSGSLLDSIPVYQDALAHCQQMYVEYLLTGNRIVTILQPQTAEMLPDGKTIFEFIDEESAEILKEKFKEACGMDLIGSPFESFKYTQPAELLSFLSLSLESQIKKHDPRFNNGGMDYSCMLKAQVQGWKVGELDEEDLITQDLREQQEKLFPTVEAQADSLMRFLKGYEEHKLRLSERYESVYNYWTASDYEGFASYLLSEVDQHPKIFRNRNQNWLPKMEAAMQEAPTMFVFGAGHLIGAYGIVQLLRQAGYEVEQMTEKHI